MAFDPTQLPVIERLYDSGLFTQAQALAQAMGPVHEWPGPEAQVFGGRLISQLGAHRSGSAMHLRAVRRWPTSAVAVAYGVYGVMSSRGMFAGLQYIDRHVSAPFMTDEYRADLWCSRAFILASFRDFDEVQECLAKARQCIRNPAWLHVQEAYCLRFDDRVADALEAVWRALEVHPRYSPALRAAADFLTDLERHDEAIDLLGKSAVMMENGWIHLRLAQIHRNLQQYALARVQIDQAMSRLPMLDKHTKDVFLDLAADSAYFCGDFAAAAEWGEQARTPAYRQIAQNIKNAGPDAKRVLLPVPQVLQRQNTCAPATLASLSGFWGRPIDHLEIAEKICYDGTPMPNARQWCIKHGFIAREFTMTWDVLRDLIDRGIPFALCTSGATSAHMQAVAGYDQRRGMLLIRDPSNAALVEVFADKFIEFFKDSGPRAMVVVPEEKRALLDGLELPDEEQYVHFDRLNRALEEHRRSDAAEAVAKMAELGENHRLTLEGRVWLANYDHDLQAQLVALDGLIALFPDSLNWASRKAWVLNELDYTHELQKFQESFVARKFAPPVMLAGLARTLLADASQSKRAYRLVRRAMRLDPSADQHHLLGSVLWNRREFEAASIAYRVAMCMNDKDESHARAYFSASRHLRRTDSALSYIERRFERYGAKSPRPGQTLCYALDRLDRHSDSIDVLAKAIAQRPTDGDLRITAVYIHSSNGQLEQAQAHLDQARGHCRETSYLAAKAQLALLQGDLRGSLEAGREIVRIDPFNGQAHAQVAQRIEELEGIQASINYLKEQVERYPYRIDLQARYIRLLRRNDPESAEAPLKRFLELQPTSAWGHRELTSLLSELRRFDEAAVCLESARKLDPDSPDFFNVAGDHYALSGRDEEARATFRQGLSLRIDNGFAIRALMRLAHNPRQRMADLDFLREQLKVQVTFGESVLEFQDQADQIMDPQVLLATLREALGVRPDLWAYWSALIRQLAAMRELGEALDLAVKATDRFPLISRAWMDRAWICRLREDFDGEVANLRQAIAIGDAGSAPYRRLGDAQIRQQKYDDALKTLEQGLARDPLNIATLDQLTKIHWRLGQWDKAFERARRAIELAPGESSLWEWLADIGPRLDPPRKTVDLAREVSGKRPGDPNVWLVLAEQLDTASQTQEKLDAIHTAIRLTPLSVRGYDLLAVTLCDLGRFDDARLACLPDELARRKPIVLRGRAAWIEYKRGNRDKARSTMRFVVADEPAYIWGWQMLATWASDAGDAADLATAAENLIRLNPSDPAPMGWKAMAHMLRKERGEAKATLLKVLAAHPDYEWGGRNLFDMQLTDKEYAQARKTLDGFTPHLPPATRMLFELRLHAAADNNSIQAANVLDRLIATGDSDAVAEAGTIVSKKWPDLFAVRLSNAAKQPGTPSRIISQAIFPLRKLKRYDAMKVLVQQALKDPIMGEPVISTYTQALSEKGDLLPLYWWLFRHRTTLRKSDTLWSAAMYALRSQGEVVVLPFWARGWRTRAKAPPWGLYNFFSFLMQYRATKTGFEVARFALTLEHDRITAVFACWVVMELVFKRRIREAEELLHQARTQAYMQPHLAPIREVAKALIAFEKEIDLNPRKARDQFVKTLLELRNKNKGFRDGADPLSAAYRLSVRHVASRQRGWWARAWFWFKYTLVT